MNINNKHALLFSLVAITITISVAYLFIYNMKSDESSNVQNEELGTSVSDCSISNLRDKAKYLETFESAQDLIESSCGNPDRNLGSGAYILQWDMEDNGTLTLHQTEALFYEQNGKRDRIIQTDNYLFENIYGDYGIYYIDQEVGGRAWLGTLTLEDADSYEYEPSELSNDYETETQGFYFNNNPVGSFDMRFESEYDDSTRLEDLDSEDFLARITFKNNDEEFERFIRVDKANRKLYFHSIVSEFETIEIEKLWMNSYYEE